MHYRGSHSAIMCSYGFNIYIFMRLRLENSSKFEAFEPLLRPLHHFKKDIYLDKQVGQDFNMKIPYVPRLLGLGDFDFNLYICFYRAVGDLFIQWGTFI